MSLTKASGAWVAQGEKKGGGTWGGKGRGRRAVGGWGGSGGGVGGGVSGCVYVCCVLAWGAEGGEGRVVMTQSKRERVRGVADWTPYTLHPTPYPLCSCILLSVGVMCVRTVCRRGSYRLEAVQGLG